MTEYKYTINRYEGELLKEYKSIFLAFGYNEGSVMQYYLFRIVDEYEEEPKTLCTLFFILSKNETTNKVVAHILEPISNKNLTPKQIEACEKAAFKNLTKHFNTKGVELESIITTARGKSFAKNLEFIKINKEVKIGTRIYTEFFKA